MLAIRRTESASTTSDIGLMVDTAGQQTNIDARRAICSEGNGE